jgi:succinate dehydrogenase/fumarate reductase flavoprotein subunit
MNRTIPGVLAILAASGALLATAGPAVASTSKAYRAGSCTAEGGYAICDASGTATRPESIYVHVTSSPDQKVLVTWDMTCAHGDGAGGKSGQFHARTTVRRLIRHPYAHPAYCIVAAGAQLNTGGHLRVWISYRR